MALGQLDCQAAVAGALAQPTLAPMKIHLRLHCSMMLLNVGSSDSVSGTSLSLNSFASIPPPSHPSYFLRSCWSFRCSLDIFSPHCHWEILLVCMDLLWQILPSSEWIIHSEKLNF
jgi:hypothetical protein